MSRLTSADSSCPYCGFDDTRLLQRRRLILDLRRCARCGLMFRWPKDSIGHNRRFYQKAYRQSMAPKSPEQQIHPHKLFQHGLLNISGRIALLQTIMPAGRVLDYGSSWGYGTYQLQAAGYDAVGYEVSRPRAELARKRLGVPTITDFCELDDQSGTFDTIFCLARTGASAVAPRHF
jgi:hypothetical protein